MMGVAAPSEGAISEAREILALVGKKGSNADKRLAALAQAVKDLRSAEEAAAVRLQAADAATETAKAERAKLEEERAKLNVVIEQKSGLVNAATVAKRENEVRTRMLNDHKARLVDMEKKLELRDKNLAQAEAALKEREEELARRELEIENKVASTRHLWGS